MNYKDMTFCTFNKKCKDSRGCSRAFTKAKEKDAMEWTKEIDPEATEPLISQFRTRPHCFKMKGKVEVVEPIEEVIEPIGEKETK